ncbi:hypothetical protein EX30DRAFT_355758 [Ascodesmis nigricans]|uniref:Cyclic-AMP phosphodiesterase n=1 Tax=Ascodesmis nigricans TaxID=341454 RepID=A0A4S2MST7_9PEZI|nr:hypothetical protein EX30DRAFT_355758 [Ascodesmis nigricans]
MGASPTPAFHIIVLGSGGGPSEDNVSGYLVRSVAKRWGSNSAIALDAGTHLAGIIDILVTNPPLSTSLHSSTNNVPVSPSTATAPTEPRPRTASVPTSIDLSSAAITPSFPSSPSPFEGYSLPHISPTANAAYILQTLISSYLITHTHLDHISGLIMNTASFTHTHPKYLVSHHGAITHIKKHIFNNVIWPNLSDENGGVGLLSYRRLRPGDSFTPVADGLSAQIHLVSHGQCINNHLHHQHPSRASSVTSSTSSAGTAIPQQDFPLAVVDSSAFFLRCDHTHSEILLFGDVEPDTHSLDPRNMIVWSLAAEKIVVGRLNTIFIECSYDDSQPDNMLFGHLTPRYLIQELGVLAREVEKVKARRDGRKRRKRESVGGGYNGEGGKGAAKIRRVSAGMGGSRRGSVGTSLEGGVRTPPPEEVGEDEGGIDEDCRETGYPELDDKGNGNGKSTPPATADKEGVFRSSFSFDDPGGTPPSITDSVPVIPPSIANLPSNATATAPSPHPHPHPLSGITIVITHVKEPMIDGIDVKKNVWEQLKQREKEAGLGCKFVMARRGLSLYV